MRMHVRRQAVQTGTTTAFCRFTGKIPPMMGNGNIFKLHRNGDVSNGGTGYKMDALAAAITATSDGQLIDNQLKKGR